MPDELARQIEPLHACDRGAGLAAAGDRRRRGGRRHRHAGAPGRRSSGIAHRDLHRRQGSGATRQSPMCALVNTMSNETLDEAGVVAKFGVPPERIVDYLALVGDAVDNVPGVDKVGPKTAVKWLQQYGSLDDIVAHADEIGGVVGENLRAALRLPAARRASW
ncbi:MAG: hypothetical protein MZW92_64660 [Comamonadaceae bacterium]|nr:hypothetical protein [Comamonadaceae bacterium]